MNDPWVNVLNGHKLAKGSMRRSPNKAFISLSDVTHQIFENGNNPNGFVSGRRTHSVICYSRRMEAPLRPSAVRFHPLPWEKWNIFLPLRSARTIFPLRWLLISRRNISRSRRLKTTCPWPSRCRTRRSTMAASSWCPSGTRLSARDLERITFRFWPTILISGSVRSLRTNRRNLPWGKSQPLKAVSTREPHGERGVNCHVTLTVLVVSWVPPISSYRGNKLSPLHVTLASHQSAHTALISSRRSMSPLHPTHQRWWFHASHQSAHTAGLSCRLSHETLFSEK